MTRRFELHRHQDVTGVSGAGVVAEGVEWSTGKACLSWCGALSSVAVYDSMGMLTAIHGHDGATEVVWLDVPSVEPSGRTIQIVAEGGLFDGQMLGARYDDGGEMMPIPDPHIPLHTDTGEVLYRFDRGEPRDEGPAWVYVLAARPGLMTEVKTVVPGCDDLTEALTRYIREARQQRDPEEGPGRG